MAKKGDITRARSVKAEFDNSVRATPNAGNALVERTMRRLGLRRIAGDHLPPRPASAVYSSTNIAYSLVAALLSGGKGLQAGESLRANELDAKVFGLETGLATEGTVYNALCDMAGLERRSFEDVHFPAGPSHPSLTLFGTVAKKPRWRRTVPDEPEAALPSKRESLADFIGAMAKRCLKALPHKIVYLDGHVVGFADATQLEVRGRCFDAAEVDYKGNKSFQWATFMVGPTIAAQSLEGGAANEAHRLAGLADSAGPVIDNYKGPRGVLVLCDAAYLYDIVLREYEARSWKYIMSANLYRDTLTRQIALLNDALWTDLGPDAGRGWQASSVTVFKHRFADWKHETRIVAIRYMREDEFIWRYTFLATNLGAGDLPKHRVEKYGFGQYIRMLYSTKQARENHYKTPLRDLGLHHPPSSRLGVNEVFYALASAASNIAMVLRYRVVKGEERGIQLWRLRERYLRLAGRVVRGARTLKVILFGGGIPPDFQDHWLQTFGEAALI